MDRIKIGFLYFLCVGVAGYAAVAYGLFPLGSLVHPDMKLNYQAHPVGIYTHIFTSILALIIGPFQFSQRLLTRNKNMHRWLGRVYLAVGVLIGGLSGLYMSLFAYGGAMSKLGFATLAVLWIFTGFRAYSAIRKGDITEHKKWMIRNFSLTFAAVTLRIYLPLSMVAGIEFSLAYSFIAWLCWLPNIVFVEWRFNRLQ